MSQNIYIYRPLNAIKKHLENINVNVKMPLKPPSVPILEKDIRQMRKRHSVQTCSPALSSELNTFSRTVAFLCHASTKAYGHRHGACLMVQSILVDGFN